MHMVWNFTTRKQDRPLLNERGTMREGVLVWGDWENKPVELTEKEIRALQKAHKSKNINLSRAKEVKRLIGLNCPLHSIVAVLKRNGRGFGERQVEKDHSALKP